MSGEKQEPSQQTLKVELEASGLVNEETGEVAYASASEGWLALRALEEAISWTERRLEDARNKVKTLKAEVRTQEGRIATWCARTSRSTCCPSTRPRAIRRGI